MKTKKRRISLDKTTYNPVILLNINDREISHFSNVTSIYSPVNASTFTEEDDNYFNVPENELTSFSMKVSEKSLEEVWEDEDDDYWESFL